MKVCKTLFLVILAILSTSCDNIAQNATKKTTRNVLIKKVAKKTLKEIQNEFSDDLANYKQLQERLLKKGYTKNIVGQLKTIPINIRLAAEIEKLAINEKTLQNLIADINTEPSFLRFLNQEPANLHAYSKLSQTSKFFRMDHERLQWLNNLQRQSTKYSNAQKLTNRYAIKDLRITESNGVLYYYDGDQLLATETNKIFKATTFSNTPNNFLNQNLYPNATYIVDDRYLYITDSRGRIIHAEADLVLQKKGRDASLQAIGRDESGIYSGINAPYDDGGHIFAQEVGGPTELINILPQLKIQNRGNEWRHMERRIVNLLNEGKTVKLKVNLRYDEGDMFARPNEYRITQIIEGVPEALVISNIL